MAQVVQAGEQSQTTGFLPCDFEHSRPTLRPAGRVRRGEGE
jgi:hypothetical protein